MLTVQQVTVHQVKDILDSKYDVTVDEDGDLVVTKGKFEFFVSIIAKSKLIRCHAGWKKPDELSFPQLLLLANQFNFDKHFLRVYIDPQTGGIRTDYYMLYAGGLLEDNLLDAVDWFCDVTQAWVKKVLAEIDEGDAE